MGSKHLHLLLIAVTLLGGCSRCHYRVRADRDTYRALKEKTNGRPWFLPSGFSIYPDPASRLYFESSLDDPALPIPSPQLYSYQLPITPGSSVEDQEAMLQDSALATRDGEVLASPIPPAAWEDIPPECRIRMFDFASLRDEATLTERTYNRDVRPASGDKAPRLTFRQVLDLALLNSRDYQAQKEALYRVALRLSLERYDYSLNPSANGLNSAANFTHNRNGGLTVNNLSIPTVATAEKALVTGGDLLARFANSVLLTFNGPQGFATDVSSDLLLDISQPIFQRDIAFESLTQAERAVVYAARDFASFRRQFFADFAAQYYSVIRTFRQVEIDSQNYFSLVRAFNQAEAEYRAGLVPRVQVDQVEQNLLSGRGGLIGTCNGLEQALDGLKIDMGLPTELPINIDLTELNELTKRDQLSVADNLIERVQRRLSSAQGEPERVELLSTGVVLIDRILDASKIRSELDMPPLQVDQLRHQRGRMLVESARLTAREVAGGLEQEINSESPSLPVIFQRTLALANELLILVEQQLELSKLLERDVTQIDAFQSRATEARELTNQLRDELQQMIRDEQLLLLPDLVRRSGELRAQVEGLVAEVDQLNGTLSDEIAPEIELQQTVEEMNQLLATTQQILGEPAGGLVPIDIDVDHAMLTALVLRFDLMNERGFLADDWRSIKLAADDLKSILDLNASQEIRTRTNVNRVFDFTWDESRTALQLRFDAPVNRRAQRNSFRSTLIDYQAALRSLTQLEDNIKFSVRNDLRNLALDREQYDIAVASAALAFERVVSTSLEFRLGTGGVSARDFLEAQTAYIDALSAVASRHIDYIVDRTQLFLDLEQLTVGDDGFWEPLYDERFQPESFFELPPWAAPAYGNLPCVWYSKKVHRMLHVPTGESIIHKEPPSEAADREVTDSALPEPRQQ